MLALASRAFGAACVAAVACVAASQATGSTAPPANDARASAQPLVGERGVVRGSNIGATKEALEPAHAGDEGGASVWYVWTAPASGQFGFTTAESGFDTLLAVYTSTAGGLAPVAASDDAGGRPTSDVSFAAVAGTQYWIAVDGFAGKEGRIVLRWSPAPDNDNFASALTLQGRSGAVKGTTRGATLEDAEPAHWAGGSSVWFRWTAPRAGTARFTTRGSEFETILAVYRGSELAVLERVGGDAGEEGASAAKFVAEAGVTYAIALDGFEGRSGLFVLGWSVMSPPPNDAFASAIRLRGPAGSLRGSNVASTGEEGEASEGASVWYRWRAAATGPVVFTTAGSAFDTVLVVYRGQALERLVPIRGNDDSVFGLDSFVTFRAAAGVEYRILVDGFDGDEGRFVLSWGRVIAGTAGADRLVGTRGSDLVLGLAGGDVLRGRGGPDVLQGGAGDDRVDARDGVRGNDVAFGGPGTDVCPGDRRDRRFGCEPRRR